ncbi:MAG: zinc ABC transporter substrate-binding protein [Candidatus Diapherotrites archaeon]|nr:zinc ABC transporter substrate-binding protein [Candidatus Diapherotrites archaeon]
MKKEIMLLSVLVICVFLVSGCVNNAEKESGEKVDVIVSILPQKAFVKAVGGEHVNVKALIPPGGSPATYEPRPSDLANVEKAELYFRIGHIPFEKSHVDKFAGLNPDMKVVDTSRDVPLRYFGEHEEHTHENEHREEEHRHEGVDPHIWLSPMQVKKQVDVIADALSEVDPNNSAEYMRNAEAFKKELDGLHSELKSIFKELKTGKLMVFHPAWGYFADEYDLEQIAIERDGKEPTAIQLQNLIGVAREEDIKVIFIQSQFNKKIAESVAEEIGAVVVPVDALSEDYVNNLRNVAMTISEHLNK